MSRPAASPAPRRRLGLPGLAGALALLIALAGAGLEDPSARAQQAQGAAQGTSQGASQGASGQASGDEAAPRFFRDLDDLPLMAGLQEMPEASVAFDKPGGRIGEVYAEGAVPAARVRAFYGETLPQFGWKPQAPDSYRRDGERLELEISESAGVTTLRLSLSPTD